MLLEGLSMQKNTDKKYFVVFRSIHDTLSAERLLKKQSVSMELSPLPMEISKACGLCILIPHENACSAFETIRSGIDAERFEIYSYDGSVYTVEK